MPRDWIVGIKIVVVALALIAVALGLYIHQDYKQTLVSIFFIGLGIYSFIFPFLDKKTIYFGVNQAPPTASLFLRIPLFYLGLLLYISGIYRLFF